MIYIDFRNFFYYFADFRKYILKTLTTLVMQVKDINNKLDEIRESRAPVDNQEVSDDEFDHLPIHNEEDLLNFEKKLKNPAFFKKSVSF